MSERGTTSRGEIANCVDHWSCDVYLGPSIFMLCFGTPFRCRLACHQFREEWLHTHNPCLSTHTTSIHPSCAQTAECHATKTATRQISWGKFHGW